MPTISVHIRGACRRPPPRPGRGIEQNVRDSLESFPAPGDRLRHLPRSQGTTGGKPVESRGCGHGTSLCRSVEKVRPRQIAANGIARRNAAHPSIPANSPLAGQPDIAPPVAEPCRRGFRNSGAGEISSPRIPEFTRGHAKSRRTPRPPGEKGIVTCPGGSTLRTATTNAAADCATIHADTRETPRKSNSQTSAITESIPCQGAQRRLERSGVTRL